MTSNLLFLYKRTNTHRLQTIVVIMVKDKVEKNKRGDAIIIMYRMLLISYKSDSTKAIHIIM